MYLPVAMFGIVYLMRALLRHFMPARLALRKLLVFLLAMYSLILLMGCFTGYARWLALDQGGRQAEAEILFQGGCNDAIYGQGRYMRAYKTVRTQREQDFSPRWQPYETNGTLPCIGYRFFEPEMRLWVYAQEEVTSSFLNWPLGNFATVKYEEGYIENNWLAANIPATMQSAMHYAWFFAAVLLEALFSGYFMGIRKSRSML